MYCGQTAGQASCQDARAPVLATDLRARLERNTYLRGQNEIDDQPMRIAAVESKAVDI